MTNIKRIAQAKGISQSQLSKATNISIKTIQNWYCKKTLINSAEARSVKKIADALGCQMDDLLESE